MYIEGIALDHFSATTKPGIVLEPESGKFQVVLHFFFSDDSKQYAATTSAHRK